MKLNKSGSRYAYAVPKRSKYGNRKVEKNGEKFDSVREYERHLVLLDMQKRGEIAGLRRQVRLPLKVNGKLVCTYVADWTYNKVLDRNFPGGPLVSAMVVDDAKGVKTPAFAIKWKLVQALYPQWSYVLS